MESVGHRVNKHWRRSGGKDDRFSYMTDGDFLSKLENVVLDVKFQENIHSLILADRCQDGI